MCLRIDRPADGACDQDKHETKPHREIRARLVYQGEKSVAREFRAREPGQAVAGGNVSS